MCIIINKIKPQTKISDLIIENAEINNPDGFGIVYTDTGECRKTTDYDEARKWIAEKRTFVAHYRFATVGAINKKNCHPFPIPNSNEVLFSNGTVPLGNHEKTDTEEIAELLEGECDEVRDKILSMTDTRFAIVDTLTCEVKRYGVWHKKEGVWYSKSNCFATMINNSCYWNPTKPMKKKGTTYMAGHSTYEYHSNLEDEYEESEAKFFSDFDDRNEKLPAYGWNGITKVAVYGTLKASHGNHNLLQDSEFIGAGYTIDEHKMEVMGAPTLHKNAKGSQIEVEMYECSSWQVREDLDNLEGHPYNYRRELTDIIDLEGNTVRCWIYFIYRSQPDENIKHHPSYTKNSWQFDSNMTYTQG
jgi:gamma-glutamylaminecyclotransferase